MEYRDFHARYEFFDRRDECALARRLMGGCESAPFDDCPFTWFFSTLITCRIFYIESASLLEVVRSHAVSRFPMAGWCVAGEVRIGREELVEP